MQEKTVFFASYDQALEYRKSLASTGAQAAFGVTATTFASWLKSSYELYGDGRCIVSAAHRLFAVRWLLENEPGAQALQLTDGGIVLICRFLSQNIGLPELDSAVAEPPASLSEQERAVLGLIEPYRALLAKHGYIEPGDALAGMAGQFAPAAFELSEGVDPGAVFEWFVSATNSTCTCWEAEEPVITPAPSSCKSQFLFASGPSCEDALVSDYVQETLATGVKRMLVATSRPEALFGTLSQALGGSAQCVLRASRPFAQTAFGRTYLAVREFILSEAHDPLCLVDYFASPFSGVGAIDTANIYSQILGNRLLAYDDLHALAHLVSPNFDLFEELAADSDASLLLDRMLDVAEELKGMDASEILEQQAAIVGLRNVYEAARSWNVSPADFEFVLSTLSISAARSTSAASAVVEVLEYSKAPNLAQGTYDAVLACDMDARYHSAGEPHNALTTLTAKLGIASDYRVLARERRTFQQLKALATGAFAVERVLNAGGDEDIYPSFVLDEYLGSLLEPAEEANEFGVPEHLQQNMLLRNEAGAGSSYAANYDPAAKSPIALQIPGFAPGEISSALKPELCLARVRENPQQLVLSPSAIENYVNCPYLWFINNVLRPQSSEEGLGPLETGSFAHSVFENFYQRFSSELGYARVTEQNLDQAQELLGRVFDELLQAQPQVEDGVRYLPLSPTERAEADRLRETLIGNLALQACVMPEFVPVQQEFKIDPNQGIDYAGVRLRGRVDRIDVNAERGHFAVVDYKGGLGGHDAGYNPDDATAEGFTLPGKIQALIYAQAIRRMGTLGYPVGALYMSYRASQPKGMLAGSYDAALLDVHDYTHKAAAVEMNFEAFLDQIESMVQQKLQGLTQGCIEPNPLNANSCKYCPAKNCERRL